ncbi:MAG: DUF1800 family protein [Acidobacteria bacterium]|nr:DUF1800 family protein [Acidobacteriota bacterium]
MGALLAMLAVVGPLSVHSTAAVVPPPPTTAPTQVRATSGNGRALIEWDAVADATSYQVFRGVAGLWDPAPVATVSRPRVWNTGLQNGTTYDYKVVARNRGGNGPASAVVSVIPLGPPTGLTATAGVTSVSLAWQAVPGATSYTVYRRIPRDGAAFEPLAANVIGLAFVDDGLDSTAWHVYRVQAVAGPHSGPLSTRAAARPLPTPPATAPAGLTAAIRGGRLVLTWARVDDARGYAVYRSATGAFDDTPVATVGSPVFRQDPPAAGTALWFQVAAVNAGGSGPVSATIRVSSGAPPVAPSDVQAVGGDGQVTVSWAPVAGADAYHVYRGTAPGDTGAVPVASGVAASPFVDATVVNGQTYYYQVSALGADGEGARSAEVHATPQAPPTGTDPDTVAAFRFLRQATWGPKPGDVERVKAIGFDAFLAEQFAAPVSTYPDALFDQVVEASEERFMQLALSGPDQLRQRLAWALYKVWVVSAVEVDYAPAIVTYYRLFMEGAFGNYRDLMRQVTLNPAMGEYLSMLNNKGQHVTGVPANENYPRELLQLFTLGLSALGPDGTPQPGPTGQPLPAYTEEDVKALARILSGWTFGDGDPSTTPRRSALENFRVPMEPVAAYHDPGEKVFLGETFPAGQTAVEDLEQALDVIFLHPNVGPFVSRQLIQQLVTSNPSPGYVRDVAAVFADNGTGTRGDLAAVVAAILTHPEAGVTSATSGKLSEPVLFVVSQLRALNATVTDHPFMSDKVSEMGQRVFYPPSVFSYFPPGYRVAGTGVPPLMGPEFQGLTQVTAMVRANFVASLLGGSFAGSATVDFTPFRDLALEPERLVDYVSLLFTGGRLSDAERAEIVAAVLASPDTRRTERSRTAIFLTLVPGQFQVDR